MALLLPHSVFIHVPKTGGSWVRAAIRRSGIPVSELQCNWHAGTWDKPEETLLPVRKGHQCWHNFARDIDTTNRFTFSFVRHPLSFYVSYWTYRHSIGWEKAIGMDTVFRGETFDAFLDSVIEHSDAKGWLASIYRLFLIRDGEPVDFIGKQESLADDLVHALRLAGETFNEHALRSTPMNNVVGRASGFILTDAQRERILSYERDVIERYGYNQPASVAYFSRYKRRLEQSIARVAAFC